MKKNYILVFILAVFFGFTAKAQTCTPDPAYAVGQPGANGVHPDSAQGFSSGTVGVAYNQNITVTVPQDTVVGTPPFAITIPYDSVHLVDIQNLPPGLTYMCSGTSTPTSLCTWLGNTSGCAAIYGTPTTDGQYNLTIHVNAYVGGSSSPVSQTLMYYKIIIAPSTAGIPQNISYTFDVKQNAPNPFSGSTTIRFTAPNADEKVKFSVYNTLGKLLMERKIDTVKGDNEIEVDGKNLSGGLYFYTIEYKGKTFTKRMLVANN